MTTDKRKWKSPDLNQQVSDFLVAGFNVGELPWESSDMLKGVGRNVSPYNAISGHVYRGWNQLFLSSVAAEKSGEIFDPRFCTFKQASDNGWRVKKGSVSSKILMFKPVIVDGVKEQGDVKKPKGRLLDKLVTNTKQENPDRAHLGTNQVERKVWLLRSFSVFHASQIDGIPDLEPHPLSWNSSEVVRTMREALEKSGLRIFEGASSEPQYNADVDVLLMPDSSSYGSRVEFDAALTAGLSLASGHPSRLGRVPAAVLNEDQRMRERLIADFAGAMVCGQVGISYTSPFSHYRSDWVSLVESDKRLALRSVGVSGRCADYLIQQVPGLAESMASHRGYESGIETVTDEIDLESFDLSDSHFDVAEIQEWVEVAGAEADLIDLSIFDVKSPDFTQKMQI